MAQLINWRGVVAFLLPLLAWEALVYACVRMCWVQS